VAATARPTILICDDEAPLRELMRAILENGYDFVEAADAGEALERAIENEPDLVLLDVMLPGGSGLDVLREMRTHDALAATPVVVVTAWTSAADRRAALDAGADEFLAKPFDPDELSEIADRFLPGDGSHE
jgi:two-component system, OmpR family, phosphate regulon response regulator PhoB